MSWGSGVQVDEGGYTGTYNSISSWANTVYAVMRFSDGGDWDITFRASTDGGRSWPDPMVRVDDDETEASAGSPVVAASAEHVVHVAWQDSRGDVPLWKTYASTGTLEVSGFDEQAAGKGDLRLRVAPNPSHRSQGVRLIRPRSLHTRGYARIYDASGRCVAVLPDRDPHEHWNGSDRGGRPLPAGIYWVRIDGPGGGGSCPIIRLR
jgi:hypothetical protein